MAEVLRAIREALGDFNYLYFYGAALILLLFLAKGKRKAFVVPAIFITALIISPWFFKAWNSINNYAYWRTLWMLPIIPVCAAGPTILVERTKKGWRQGVIIVLFATVIIFSGSYIYHQSHRGFGKANNAEKLPNGAVAVAEALLELDDMPFVVADNDLCIYLRQYSGKIHSMYARDIYWGDASQQAKNVYQQLTGDNGDLHEAAQIMLNYDYNYLVTKNNDETKNKALEQAGFVFVKQINQYGIFRVTGQKTEIRNYNEKHQVTSLTYVDKEGEPENVGEGYATIEYEYDENGHVSQKLIRDSEGELFLNSTGIAGYRREYDRRGLIIREEWVGKDEKNVISNGYAARVCKYNLKKEMVTEKYFDTNGAPILRDDVLYSERRFIYDGDGRMIGERYYGLDGELTLAAYGYAGYDRIYDDNDRVIRESYIDTEGKPIKAVVGYAAIVREYDEAGNVISETYLDEAGDESAGDKGYSRVCRAYDNKNRMVRESYFYEGKPFKISDGYAMLLRFYDSEGNVSEERFLGEDGKAVITVNGYSSVHYSYDEKNRKREEFYFDTDGTPAVLDPGYCKCKYTYTEDGQISLVYYLNENDERVEAGNGYLHEYLRSLAGRDISIIMAVRDEASNQITATIQEDLKRLGIQTNLIGQYRKSFYAIVTPEGTIEEVADAEIEYAGVLDGISYSVKSAGLLAGNSCSIIVDGNEYAKNVRGLNIVIFDNIQKKVVESIAFDTWAQEVFVTR